MPEEPIIPPKDRSKGIDFLGMLLNKKNLADIEMEHQQTGFPLNIYTRDELIDRYPQIKDDQQRQNDLLQYQDSWLKMYNAKGFKPFETKSLTIPDTKFNRARYGPKATYYNPNTAEFAIPEPEFGYYWPKSSEKHGATGLPFLATDIGDHFATSKGYYIDREGKKQPLELAGNADEHLKRVMSDDGMKYYWQEAQPGEIIPGDQIRQIIDRDMSSESIWGTMARGAWSGFIPLLYKGVGTAVSNFFTWSDKAMRLDLDYYNPDTWYNRFGVDAINDANWMSPQNADERRGAFESWSSGLFNLMNGTTQMFGMMATGGLIGGLARGIGFGATAGMRIGMNASFGVGGAEAGSGIKEELERLGYSKNDIEMILPLFINATILSERVLSANIVQRFGVNAMMGSFGTKASRMKAGQLYTNVFDETLKNANTYFPRFSETMKGRVIQKAFTRLSQARKYTRDLAGTNKFFRVGFAGIEEGFEEGIEGKFYDVINMFYNGYNKNVANEFIEEYDKYIYTDPVGLNRPGQNVVSGDYFVKTRKDNPNDWSLVSKDQYREDTDRRAFSDKILSGEALLTGGNTAEEMAMAALSTWLAVGMIGGGNQKHVQTTVIDFAYQSVKNPGMKDQLRETYREMEKDNEDALGVFKTADGGVTDNVDESKRMTRVDLIIQEVEFWENIIKKYGLDSKEARLAYNSNMKLGAEAARAAGKIEKVQAAIVSVSNNEPLEEDVDTGIKAGMKEDQLKDLVKTHQKQLDDIVTPKPGEFNGKPGKYSIRYTDQWNTIELFDHFIDRQAENAAIANTSKEAIIHEIRSGKRARGIKLGITKAFGIDSKMHKIVEDEYQKEIQRKKAEYKKNYLTDRKKMNEMMSKWFIATNELPGINSIIQDYKNNENAILHDLGIKMDDIVQQYNAEIKEAIPDEEISGIMSGIETQLDAVSETLDNIAQLRQKGEAGAEETFTEGLNSFREGFSSLLYDINTVMERVGKTSAEALTDESNAAYNLFARRSADVLSRLQGELKADYDKSKADLTGMNIDLEMNYDMISGIIASAEKMDRSAPIEDFSQFAEGERLKRLVKAFNQMFNEAIIRTPDGVFTIGDLYSKHKIFADEKNEQDVDNPDTVLKDINVMLQYLERLERWVDVNYPLFQQKVERNDDTYEHSPIVHTQNQRLKEGDREAILESFKTVKNTLTKIHHAAKNAQASMDKENFRQRIQQMDLKIGILNDIHQFNIPHETDKDTPSLNELDGILSAIWAKLEEAGYKGDDRKFLEGLWRDFVDGKVDVQQVQNLMNEIDALVVEAIDSLSGKLDWLVKDIGVMIGLLTEQNLKEKGVINYTYSVLNDFNDNVALKPATESVRIEGGSTRHGYESGRISFQQGGSQGNYSDEYLFHLATNVHRWNEYGRNRKPKYSSIYIAIKDYIAEKEEMFKNGKRTFAPTIDQENVLLHAIGFYFSPANPLVTGGTSVIGENIQKILNSILVRGYGGTGKSTQLFTDMIGVLSNLMKRPLKIGVVVSTYDLANGYLKQKEIANDKLENGEFDIIYTDEMLDKDLNNQYDLLWVDEVSLHGEQQTIDLGEKLNTINTATQLPVFFVGDDTQVVKQEAKGDYDALWYNYSSERTSPLNIVHRTGKKVFHAFQNKLRSQKSSTSNAKIEIDNYGYSVDEDGGKHGVESFLTINDVLDSFLLRITNDNQEIDPGIGPEEVVLIVRDQEAELMFREYFISKGYEIPQRLIKHLYPQGIKQDREKLVSGLSAENVFFAYNFDSATSDFEYQTNLFKIRNILTGTTRQVEYVAIVHDTVQDKVDHIGEYKYNRENVQGFFKDFRERLDAVLSKFKEDGGVVTPPTPPGTEKHANTYEAADPEDVRSETKKQNTRLKRQQISESFTHISDLINEKLKIGADPGAKARGLFYHNLMKYHLNPSEPLFDELVKNAQAMVGDDKINEPEAFVRSFLNAIELRDDVREFLHDINTVISPVIKTEKGNNKVQANPFAIKFVGYTKKEGEIVPIVDILHLNHSKAKESQALDNKPMLQAQLGAYMAMVNDMGMLVNNVHLHTFRFETKKETGEGIPVQYRFSPLKTLTSKEKLEALKSASQVSFISDLGITEPQTPTEEEYFEVERVADDSLKGMKFSDPRVSIEPDKYFVDDSNIPSVITKITKKTEGKEVTTYVHLMQNRVEQKMTLPDFLAHGFNFMDIEYFEYMFIESALKFSDAENRRLISFTPHFPALSADIADVYNISFKEFANDISFWNQDENKLLKARSLVTERFINSKQTRVVKRYLPSVNLMDIAKDGTIKSKSRKFDHVMVNAISEDSIKEFFDKPFLEELSKIFSYELTIKDIRTLGLNVLSNDSQVEYDFKDASFTAVGLFDRSKQRKMAEEYLNLAEGQTTNGLSDEAFLDKIFENAFLSEINRDKAKSTETSQRNWREFLVEMNKHRLRTMRDAKMRGDLDTELVEASSGRMVRDGKRTTKTLTELLNMAKPHGFTVDTTAVEISDIGIERKRFAVSFNRGSAEPTVVYFDGKKIHGGENDQEWNDYKQQVKDEFDNLKNIIDDKNLSLRQKKIKLENSTGFQLIMANKSFFTEKDEEGGLTTKDTFSPYMYVNKKNYLNIIYRGDEDTRISHYLDQIKFIFDEFVVKAVQGETGGDMYYNPYIDSKTVDFSKIEAEGIDFSNVSLWFSPSDFRGDEEAVRTIKHVGTPLGDGTEFIPFSSEMSYTPLSFSLIDVEQAKGILIDILGSENVKKHLYTKNLDIKNNILRNQYNKKVFGLFDKGMIRFSTFDGKVEHLTPRHEAMHFITGVLLSPRERASLLKDTKKRMVSVKYTKEEGDTIYEYNREQDITDRDAYEYMAVIFEDGSYKTTFTPRGKTLLQKWLHFIRAFIDKYMRHRTSLLGVLYAADRGVFAKDNARNHEVVNDQMSKVVVNKYSNSSARNISISRFGNETNINRILENEVIPKIFNNFLPTAKTMNPRMAGRSTWEAIIKAHNYYLNAWKYYTKKNEDGEIVNPVSFTMLQGKEVIEVEDVPMADVTVEQYLGVQRYAEQSNSRLAYTFLKSYEVFNLGRYNHGKSMLYIFVQRALSHLNLESILANPNQEVGNFANIIFKDPREEGADINPFDTMNPMLTAMYSAIPLYNHSTMKFKDSNNQPYGHVNPSRLHALLTYSMFRLKSEQTKFRTDAWMNVLEEMLKEMPDSVDKNTIFSFLVEFGNRIVDPRTQRIRFTHDYNVIGHVDHRNDKNKEGTEKLIGLGYMQIMNDYYKKGRIHKFFTGEGSVRQLGYKLTEEEYRDKIRTYESLISGLKYYYLTLFNRMSEKAVAPYNLRDFKLQPVTNHERLMKKKDTKSAVINRISSYNDSGLNNKIINALTEGHADHTYTVTKDGVYDIEGTLMVKMPPRKTKKDSGNVNFSSMKELLSFIGIDTEIDLLENIYDPKKVKEDLRVQPERTYRYLEDHVYAFMLSLKVNSLIYPVIQQNEEKFFNKEIKAKDLIKLFDEKTDGMYSLLNNIYKDYYSKELRPEDLSNLDEKSRGTLMNAPTPLDFWRAIESISERALTFNYQLNNPMSINPEGNPSYGFQNGSFLSDRLPMPTKEKQKSSVLLRKLVLDDGAFTEGNPFYGGMTPDGRTLYNNPILSGKIEFDHLNFISGFEYVDSGSLFWKLSKKNKFQAVLESLKKALLGDTVYQYVPSIIDPLADKSAMPFIHWGFKGLRGMQQIANVEKGSFNNKPSLKSVEVNYAAILPTLYELKTYYVNVMEQKKAKWNAITPEKSVQKTSTKGRQILKELKRGGEYIIVGGRIHQGNEITQRGNPLLDLTYDSFDQKASNYAEYLKDHVTDVKRAFGNHFESFGQDLKESGYKMSKADLYIFDKYQIQGKDLGSWIAERDKIYAEFKVKTDEIQDRINKAKKAKNNALVDRLNLDKEKIKNQRGEAVSKPNEVIKQFRKEVAENNYLDDKGNMNPFLETAFWSHYILGESLGTLIRGSSYEYEDVIDYIKRGAGPIAPGNTFDIDFHRDNNLMGESSRVYITEDLRGNNTLFEQLQKSGVIRKDLKITDGASILNPVFQQMMRIQSGSIISNLGNGSFKTMNFYTHPATGKKIYFKFNQFPTSASAFQNDPFYHGLTRFMLGDHLYHRLLDNLGRGKMSWYDAINEIIYYLEDEGKEHRQDMIDYTVFESGSKWAITNINPIRTDANGNAIFNPKDNNPDNTIDVSNRTLRVQVITKQDTIDPYTSTPRQILYNIIAGSHNIEIAESINSIFKDYTDKENRTMEKVVKKETQTKFIRGAVKDQLFRSEDPMKMMDMVRDQNIDPFVYRDKSHQAVINRLNKALTPRLPGAFHVQAFSMPRIIWIDGQPMLKEDVDVLPENYTTENLKPIQYEYKGTPIEYYEDLIEHINSDPSNVVYRPAQVIAPFKDREKFGLSAETTLQQAMSYRLIETNEAGESFPGEKTSLYEPTSEKRTEEELVKLFMENDIDFYSEVSEEVNRRYAALNTKQLTQLSGQDLEIQEVSNILTLEKTYVPKVTGEAKKVIMAKLYASYFRNFNDALDVFFVRIPTTIASMGAMGRIVAFDNGVENTLYISAEKNILDGSDWDADQLNVIYRSITEKGYNTDATSNRLFETIKRFYDNPLNYEFILSRITVDELVDLRDELYENKEIREFLPNNLGSAVRMSDVNTDGKIMVGHFVNLSNYFYKMASLPQKIRNELFPNTIFTNDEKFMESIRAISILVNAATDNAKLGGLLGMLNVNTQTSPLIAGILFEGYNEADKERGYKNLLDKMVKILNSDQVLKASNNSQNHITQQFKKKLFRHLPNVTKKNTERIDQEDVLLANGLWEEGMKPIDIRHRLRQYTHTGEQLRRFGDVATLISGIKGSLFDLNRKIANVQYDMGIELTNYLSPILAMRANNEDVEYADIKEELPVPDMKEQVEFAVGQRVANLYTDEDLYANEDVEEDDEMLADEDEETKTGPNLINRVKNLEENERKIREKFNIAEVVKEFPHMIAELESLVRVKEMISYIPMEEMYNQTFDTALKMIRKDRIFDKSAYKAFERGFSDYILGQFISDNYTNVEYNNNFLTENGYTQNNFDFSEIEDRTVFVLSMPYYLRELKDVYNDNKFISSLSVVSRKSDNHLIIELTHSRQVPPEVLSEMESDFEKLPEEIKSVFRLYSALVYGFNNPNGSFSAILDSEIEIEFSAWMEDAVIDTDLAAREILVKTHKLIPYDFSYRVNESVIGQYTGADLVRLNMSYKEDPMIIEQDEFGDYTKPVVSPYYMWMNSYTGKNTLTDNISSINMPFEEMLRLMAGENAVIPVGRYFIEFKNWAKRKFNKDTTIQVIPTGRTVNANLIKIDDTRMVSYSPMMPSDVVESRINEPNYTRLTQAVKSSDGLVTIIDHVQKVFPNIKYSFVDKSTALHPSMKSYIHGGIVHLNLSKINPHDPFHEATHIFLEIAKNLNPEMYSGLVDEALEMIKSDDPVVQVVKKLYSEKSNEDLVDEVIATVVGFKSAEKVMAFLSGKPMPELEQTSKTIFERISDKVSEFWDMIQSFVFDLFNVDNYALRVPANEFSDLSISSLADIIIKSSTKGGMLSTITSDQLKKLMHSRTVESRFENGGIKNVKDFFNATVYDMEKDEPLLAKINLENVKNIIRRYGNLPSFYVGYEVNFSGDLNSVENEARIKELMKVHDRMDNEIVPDSRDWLNDGASIEKNIRYTQRETGEEFGYYTMDVMNKLKRAILYTKHTKFARYSDLANIEGMKHLYNPMFKGFDPLIAIEYNKDGQINLSIYDITSNTLEGTGSRSIRGNMLRRFYSDYLVRKIKLFNDITLTNNNADTRRMMVQLLANHLLADSSVSISDMAVIGLRRSKVVYKNIDQYEMNNNIKAMGKYDDFMEILSKEMQELFQEKNIRYADIDLWRELSGFYQARDMKDHGLEKVIMENGEEPVTTEEKKVILRHRLLYLERNLKKKSDLNTEYAIDIIREMRLLYELLSWYHDMPLNQAQINPHTRINQTMLFIHDGNSIGGENVQRIRKLVLDASGDVNREFNKVLKPLKEKGGGFEYFYNTFGNPIKGKVSNIAEEIFDKLFVRETDDKGNDYLTGFIYWTTDKTKDEVNADKARELNLPPEVLKYGEIIVGIINEELAKLKLHQKVMSQRGLKTKEGEDYTIVNAREEILASGGYKPGMVPLMTKTYSANISTGDVFKGMKKRLSRTADVFTLYEGLDPENIKANQDEGQDLNSLGNIFWYQFGIDVSSDITELGSITRLSQYLGLDVVDSGVDSENEPYKFELKDKSRNDDLSKDLELILNYFVMSSVRNRTYEEKVMPVVNAAKILAIERQNNRDIDEKNFMTFADLFIKQAIKGERTKLDMNIAGVNLDKSLAMGIELANFVVLPFNVNIGAISMIVNAVYSYTEGVVGSLMKPLWNEESVMFTSKNLLEATRLFFTDKHKITQMMHQYQLINPNDYELTNMQYHQKTKKSILSRHYMNWMNWASDTYARSLIMTAQMLHDGTYHAHKYDEESGTVIYDPKEDKRLGWNGVKYSEEGQVLYDFMKKRLVSDGLQKADQELTRGYLDEEARKFKFLADKYVIGAYDNKTRSLLNNYLIGKMFFQLRNWTVTRITNAIEEKKFLAEGGRYIVVRNKEGELVPQWERMMVEGYVNTIIRNIVLTVKSRSIKNWKNLNYMEKRNLTKAGANVAMFTVMMLMYNLLVIEDEDDPDELGVIPDWRILRNIKYAAQSIFIFPILLEFISRPFAMVDIIASLWIGIFENIFNVKLENIGSTYPGKSQIYTVGEPFGLKKKDLDVKNIWEE